MGLRPSGSIPVRSRLPSRLKGRFLASLHQMGGREGGCSHQHAAAIGGSGGGRAGRGRPPAAPPRSARPPPRSFPHAGRDGRGMRTRSTWGILVLHAEDSERLGVHGRLWPWARVHLKQPRTGPGPDPVQDRVRRPFSRARTRGGGASPVHRSTTTGACSTRYRSVPSPPAPQLAALTKAVPPARAAPCAACTCPPTTRRGPTRRTAASSAAQPLRAPRAPS